MKSYAKAVRELRRARWYVGKVIDEQNGIVANLVRRAHRKVTAARKAMRRARRQHAWKRRA
jgi:ribosomal protein S5